MLWTIGGALALLLAAAWALGVSVAVSRGEKWIVSPDIIGGYAFHTAVGFLSLWLLMQAAG